MSVVKLVRVEEETSPESSLKKSKTRVTAKRLGKAAQGLGEDEGTKPSKTPRRTAAKTTERKPSKTAPKATPKTKKREAMVSDVMQSSVVTCGTSASLNDAARLMWEHDLGTVVVVDEQFKPVSMITDRDICMAAYTQGVALMYGQVASAMAKKLLTVPFDATIEELTELMAKAQVRRMPVVDGQGKLVGVVGMSDLMKDAQRKPTDRRRGSMGPRLVELMGELLAS